MRRHAIGIVAGVLTVVLLHAVAAYAADGEHGRWRADGCQIGIERSGADLAYGVAIGDGWAEGVLTEPGASKGWTVGDGDSWAIYLARPDRELKLRAQGVGDCPPEATTTTTTTTSLPPPGADVQASVDCDELTVTNQGAKPATLEVGVGAEASTVVTLQPGEVRTFQRAAGYSWGVLDVDTGEMLAQGGWPEECDEYNTHDTTTTTLPVDEPVDEPEPEVEPEPEPTITTIPDGYHSGGVVDDAGDPVIFADVESG